MSIHRKGVGAAVWTLIGGIRKRLPLLPADEQTRLSWLKVLKSYDEVPDVYRSALEGLANDSPFPYAVLTPSYAGFINSEIEKLVCCLDDRICVLEDVTGQLTCTCFAVKDISHVEVGKALLQSWVKINGVTDSGMPTMTEFKFNTVTDYLFAPIVEKMRSATDYSQEPDPDIDQAKFDFLSRANLKLKNYARRSLLPGENVVAIILQPEIREEVLRLFGHSFFRSVCLSHLSILTDRELILIQEGTGKRWAGDIRYGGVWHYLPLDKITSISLTDPDDDLLTMSVRLPAGDYIDSLFSVSNRQEIDGFLSRFEAVPEK
jgi:hypothetical protein